MMMGGMSWQGDEAVGLDRAAGHGVVRTAAAACLVLLSPLCSPILEPDLDSCLRQSNPHGKFFPRKDIRIMSPRECFL